MYPNSDDSDAQALVSFILRKRLHSTGSSVPHGCLGDKRGPSMLPSDSGKMGAKNVALNYKGGQS